MYNYIEKRIEINLIEEIRNLTAEDLEYVGNYMLSVIEGNRLIHHGLNKEGRPSGYTVDSYSDDSEVIGEYSVAKDYFTDYKENRDANKNYEKIRNDINHALTHNKKGKIKKIYLISSQEERASFREHFNEMDIALKHNKKLIIYGNRELSKIIYEQSKENERNAVFYKAYFPNFAQEFDNFEYYGKIPSHCENFCSDKKIMSKLEQYFSKSKNICVLFGVSGSGKTQTVIDFVHSKEREFQNYIWISGEDWKPGTSLTAIQRTRGGQPINVVGMFNYSKTILIIDSLERTIEKEEFSELKEGFSKEGIVIVTSQLRLAKDYYLQMPEFSEEVSLQILREKNIDNPDVKKVIDKCKGFPLILSTIRNMIEYEKIDRESLYKEIIQSPEGITGTDGNSIIQKILSKLDDSTVKNLEKVSNSGATTFDINFLRRFCSILFCNKLQKLSILMTTDTPDIVKIHDLICIAMKKNVDKKSIIDELEKYIAIKKGEMTPSILRQIYLLKEDVVDYKKDSFDLSECDWLTYGLLQIEGNEKTIFIKKLYKKEFSSGMPLAVVKCLIESKELMGYEINDRDERILYISKNINEYVRALEIYDDIDIKAELLHHLGKAYRRNGQYDDSYRKFKELLDIKPNWHATYGQLVTLGTMEVNSDIKQAGEKYMKLLLTDMLEDASKVPLRVSLATIARLRSYRKIANEVINTNEKVDLMCQIVASSALENIGQFFEGFVSISSIFGYHYSDSCILLAESVPKMIMVEPEIIEKQQWLNACEALANIAVAANNKGKCELYEMLISKSVEFADIIIEKIQINDYRARALSKAYIIKHNYEKAINVINIIPLEKRSHWTLYRQAEAEMLNNISRSVNTIQMALELLEKDQNNLNRKASYLHLQSKCYKQQNDIENAQLAIKKAIENCKDEKYKKALLIYDNSLIYNN